MADGRPARIQRKRTAGWRMPAGAVYVGRPSVWGNPWRVGDSAVIEWPLHSQEERRCREVPITPDLAVALYRIAFTPDAAEIRNVLAGRDLACWCPLDQPCHADVLLELANGGSVG
jgi:hypothetical protein